MKITRTVDDGVIVRRVEIVGGLNDNLPVMTLERPLGYYEDRFPYGLLIDGTLLVLRAETLRMMAKEFNEVADLLDYEAELDADAEVFP